MFRFGFACSTDCIVRVGDEEGLIRGNGYIDLFCNAGFVSESNIQMLPPMLPLFLH